MSLLERIYYFHDELTRNRFPNARALTQEFEISLSTARRDIAYLRDRLLAPLAFDNHKNGFYYTDNTFNLPFENSPRIIFLLGMLNKLAEETGLKSLPEIKQLEKKLSTLVTEETDLIGSRIQCEWVEVEHPDAKIFDTLIEALVKNLRLTITYQSIDKTKTKRTIEPVRLVNYQGRWYLFAWCTLRLAYRLFHLARIEHAEAGNHFDPAEKQPPDNLDSSFGIFKGPPRYFAEILFTGSTAELVKRQYWHKNQEVRETAEGIIFRLPVNDDREIITKIMQYGAQVKVLHPPSLVRRITKEIQDLQAIYAQIDQS